MTNQNSHPWIASYPPNVDWDVPLPAEPLPAMLKRTVEKHPRAKAFNFMGFEQNYSQIYSQVQSMAAALKSLGVTKGVKVGICLPNCPQFIVSYFAILYAGGTVVNYSPLYSKGDIARQIEDSHTNIMITLDLKLILPKLHHALENTRLKHVIIASLADALPAVKSFAYRMFKRSEVESYEVNKQQHRWNDLLKFDPMAEPVEIDPQADIAVLQYTGGTTGVPKGVVLTHANCSVNALQCRLWFAQATEGEERIIAVLPMFHVFAMTTILNMGVMLGAQILLHPRFDIDSLLKDVQKNKATLMPGVSTLFNAVNNSPNTAKYDLTSLKFCISGGGALPESVKAAFEEKTGCVLVEGYGLSEAAPVVSCNPLMGENRSGSVGIPFPQTILEIIDKEDKTTVLGVGEEGEICIRGPQVMREYWRNEAESSNVLTTLENGEKRLHTGDIGIMEADGYFRIVDRLKELIITGGYNVYPRHVEEAIYRHKAVADCAVIGVENKKRGEVPKAFVVILDKQTLDAQELRTFLKTQLPPYAIPYDIEFRDELPKTLVGKVDKKPLREEQQAKDKSKT